VLAHLKNGPARDGMLPEFILRHVKTADGREQNQEKKTRDSNIVS